MPITEDFLPPPLLAERIQYAPELRIGKQRNHGENRARQHANAVDRRRRRNKAARKARRRNR